MAKTGPKEYTAKQLAQKAGVSAAYVRRLLNAGVITGRKVGHFWVINAVDAERWLDTRR